MNNLDDLEVYVRESIHTKTSILNDTETKIQ